VSGWAERFALLDELLRKRLAPGTVDPLVAHAWGQLQVDGVRVAELAKRLGVSRRYLELGFQRQVGVPPGVVGRIARFQRAVGMLARRTAPLAATAADCGYADQAHFTREVRAMSGLTPTELFAFLQFRDLAPSLASDA
jgi:AraC-like DNA-binding protein